jgi:hypothetical protein
VAVGPSAAGEVQDDVPLAVEHRRGGLLAACQTLAEHLLEPGPDRSDDEVGGKLVELRGQPVQQHLVVARCSQ